MDKVLLISNGDFRDAVGVNCWPKQEETLQKVEEVFRKLGVKTERGNPYKPEKKHGFINTQAEACSLFKDIPIDRPVVLVLSSWVWAHHCASPLKLHRGPILLLGNFDGTWPGLVALLNHSATFARLGITHSKVWTDGFTEDELFIERVKTWVESGSITYPTDHLTDYHTIPNPKADDGGSINLAENILRTKRILGQFDPGCMGMLNAVISPDRLAAIGMPLELLSQSDLLSEMELVTDKEAEFVFDWLTQKHVTFHFGSNPAEELTKEQVLIQMKMYIAAGRMYERYGLSAIGIPYQYGLVRGTCASDLPEGMLNNSDRPDIVSLETGKTICPGKPLIHFNEGDIGSGVPQVLMYDILQVKGRDPETTLHDVRWGKEIEGRFIWFLEVSGGAPPAHFGGWKKTEVFRQTPMYFPKGGGTCSGISKPGTITWARFHESFGELGMDIGAGEVVELPEKTLADIRNRTSAEWPIATAYFPGYGRDELMSTHKSNHITICYGNIVKDLAATAERMGIPVALVGDASTYLG